MRKLAEHLKEKYTIDKETGEVIMKKDFRFKSIRYNKEIVIPVEHIFVSSFTSKNNRNVLSRCVPKITHAYLLRLAEELNIELEEPDIIRRPDAAEDYTWGYCIVRVKDKNIFGDGEVHDDTLKGNMLAYAFTMMVKRAQDRAISNAIGLYSHGFYTETEDLGEDEIVSTQGKSINYDEAEREDDGIAATNKTKSKSKSENDKLEIKKSEKKDKKIANEEEEEIEYDEDGEKQFLVNRIKLISELTAIPLDEIAFNAVLEEGKDIQVLDDLINFKISSLKKVVKEAEKDLDKDDLRELLVNVIKNYKTAKKIQSKKFKEQLADVLDIDSEDFNFDDLTISDCYEVIDVLSLWSYIE